MLPDIRLVKSDPLRSLLSYRSYNLDTHLLREADEPAAGTTVTMDVLRQVMGSSGVLVHESTHWVQHHGTSIGCLLSLIAYSQHRTVIHWLRELPRAELQQLFRSRKSGVPIVAMESDTLQLAIPRSSRPNSGVNTFRQIWYDHRLVYNTFLESSVQDRIGWPRSQVIGEILGDAMLAACYGCHLGEYPGNDLARTAYRFSDREIAFVKRCGVRLTTRSIMETAATTTELHYYLISAATSGSAGLGLALQQFVERSFNALIDPRGQYGVAARVFFESVELPVDNLWRTFPTLCAVCDLALNPPVPPLDLSASGSSHWSDIYPPLRFLNAVSAVRRIGFLDSPTSDHASFANYIVRLADASGIPTFRPEMSHPYARRPERSNFTEWVNGDDFMTTFQSFAHETRYVTPDYFEFILWVQSRNWQLRGNSLPLLVDLGGAVTGAFKTQFVEYVTGQNDGNLWFLPQLVWTDNGSISSPAESSEFRSWLLTSTAFHYFLTDLLAGLGDLDESWYPPQVRRHKSFLPYLREQYEAMLGVPIW